MECDASTGIIRLFFEQYAPKVLASLADYAKQLPDKLSMVMASKDERHRAWLEDLPESIRILVSDGKSVNKDGWISADELKQVTFELTGSRASGH